MGAVNKAVTIEPQAGGWLPGEVGAAGTPILQIRKLGLREVKPLAQGPVMS